MGSGAVEELVVLSPHPSSAAAEAAAAAAAAAAAGGRDPAALERKLSLARWRSGGGSGGGVVVNVAASSSSSPSLAPSASNAAALAAAAAASVPTFKDERIEELEQALAAATASAIPDDDDHAAFIRIPAPLRKGAARYFIVDKSIARFWENRTSLSSSVDAAARVAAAAALGALRTARASLGPSRALLPAPPAVLTSFEPALVDSVEWQGSLLVAGAEAGHESDDTDDDDDKGQGNKTTAAPLSPLPASVAVAVSGCLRRGRAAPDQLHCLEEVEAVFEVAEWVAHWSCKGWVVGNAGGSA